MVTTGTQVQNVTATDDLAFVFNAFIRNRRAIGRTDGTVELYSYAVNPLMDFLEKSEGSTAIGALPYAVMEDFFIDYMKTGRAKATANRVYRSLRALFNWAYRRKLITYNPFTEMDAPSKTASKAKAGYSNDEVKTLFIQVRQQMQEPSREGFLAYRDHALMLVLYDTGLRATEMCNMKVGMIDPDTGIFEVHGKGGKLYRRRVGVVARMAITSYLQHCAARFLIGDETPLWRGWTGVPMTRSGIFQMNQTRAALAGIKNGGAHKWRYTHAEVLEDLGWPEDIIMAEMGHSMLSVNRGYRQRAITRRAMAQHEADSPADKMAATV